MSMIPELMGGRKLSHSLDFDSSAAASALLRLSVQTINMADAGVTLVTKQTSTSGEVQLKGQILVFDAQSSGTEKVLLPAEADSKGLFLIVHNTGGEAIAFEDDADNIVVITALATGESALLWCDGSTTTTFAGGAGHVGWTGVLLKHLID
jgi:hypothetical protein|tara:strand:+ start:224 stop:676 length:453 start_codon:yes stop_codon:yes gene_type:complete